MRKLYLLIIFYGVCANAQNIVFPDANFKAKLLTSEPGNGMAENLAYESFAIDADNDGEISEAEALQVSRLNVNSYGISDLTGLEFFTNLELFSCSYNTIATVDLSALSHLTHFFNTSSNTQSLTLSSSIEVISCAFNQLTVLDVSNSPLLQNISCWGNQISNLDIPLLPNLKSLNCKANLLTSLDFSQSHHMEFIDCSDNAITSLNLTGIEPTGGTAVLNFTLDCSNNNLTSLDTSVMINAKPNVGCSGNPNLTFINVMNGAPFNDPCCILPPEPGLFFENTPNLQHICADAMNFTYLQAKIDFAGYNTNPDCVVDASCMLGNGSFEADSFVLYPNPVESTLNIESINGVEVKSVSIYNLPGQLVMITGNFPAIDVSALQSGNYLMKIHSDKENIITRFIKQ